MKITIEYLQKLEQVALVSTKDNQERYINDISATITAADSLGTIPNIDDYEPTFHTNFASSLAVRKRTIEHENYDVAKNIKNTKNNLIPVQNERGNEGE